VQITGPRNRVQRSIPHGALPHYRPRFRALALFECRPYKRADNATIAADGGEAP
jgi:hypothetical protein